MIQWLFPRIIGGKNERELNRIRPTVARINEIEIALQREPVERLRELTAGWQRHLSRYHPLDAPTRSRIGHMAETELRETARKIQARLDELRQEFSSIPASVDATPASIESAKAAFHAIEPRFAKSRAAYLARILPDAYAVVKNAARRLCGTEILVNGQPQVWRMIHFDVQLIGGIALHRGMIAEMQTGEGKTLVATLPVFLNALTGLGVHVVTVNEYLARRDSQSMGALFRFLGLSVGCLENQMEPHERRAAYACDITYGTNSEFGFDYLRDNGIATTRGEQVQRGHYLAVIDEVDSILIDEARTPLLITGASSLSSRPFEACRPLVEKLVRLQTELCNGLAAEAKRHLKEGDHAAAGLALFKLKLGQPRNRQFLRLMETPETRRLLEKTILTFQHGAFQKDVFKLREELYFVVDEKGRSADLMEKGRRQLSPGDPDSFTLPDIRPLQAAIDADPALGPEQRQSARRALAERMDEQASRIHVISQLLKAYCLHERDVDYVVRDGKVGIIDESTGREMEGRRWSDGLHQAVEAKERVRIEEENQTYATITIQNYFRLYEKLAGMTGTAETEAAEFHDIYQLDVLPIPTNTPNIRIDENDQVFKTRREKYQAVIEAVSKAHSTGQPVLIGTASVDASETLSRLLTRAGIPHSVLNAKHHEQEAGIVALAGQRGAVTVSTNMAGRGTDIQLGEGVAALGGLFVIGTERHPSRRVDRQLRGRCSRQGDPGRSRFFISLEDDLMRNHASPQQMAAMIEQARKSGRPSPLGGMIETAQRRVEQRDYRSRKQVLDFDDVMNLQRDIIYGYRNEVLTTENTRQLVHTLIDEVLGSRAEADSSGREARQCDPRLILEWLQAELGIRLDPPDLSQVSRGTMTDRITSRLRGHYDSRVAQLPQDFLEHIERQSILGAVDRAWREHLTDMDEVRDGVYLRAQGQKDPLVEYKNEGFALFTGLMETIRRDALRALLRLAGEAQPQDGQV